MVKKQFNAVEVLEMAKEIEQKGMNYYGTFAEISDNEEIKQLFSRLQSEEQDHYQTIEDIENKIKEKTDPDDINYIYDPQVSGYLKTLVEFSIFPAEIPSQSQKAESIDEIILTAIMAEKESILFYTELSQVNKGETLEVIKRMIEEEKQHLKDLSEISQKFS